MFSLSTTIVSPFAPQEAKTPIVFNIAEFGTLESLVLPQY